MARSYCVWWLHSRSREWKNVTARNWPSWSTNSFISDHISTFHDSAFKTVMPLEWLEVHAWYYPLHDILNNVMVWSDWQLKSPTSTENNDELVSGFTQPSSFTTQVSSQQQHLRTPWQCIQQFDVSSMAVSTCMYDGVLYYFMQRAITSEMNFVITLVDKTTVSWWALLIALVYQCADC